MCSCPVSPESKRRTQTQRLFCWASTLVCWPSTLPSFLELKTPAGKTMFRIWPTGKPTSSWTLMNMLIRIVVRVRLWQPFFTSSCWLLSCGTLYTGPSWRCVWGQCNAMCLRTGLQSASLWDGVRVTNSWAGEGLRCITTGATVGFVGFPILYAESETFLVNSLRW